MEIRASGPDFHPNFLVLYFKRVSKLLIVFSNGGFAEGGRLAINRGKRKRDPCFGHGVVFVVGSRV